MLPASKHVKSVYLGDAEATELTEEGLCQTCQWAP